MPTEDPEIKNLTVDVVLNTGSELAKLLKEPLIDAFKQASNMEGLATRLTVPILLTKVTVVQYGADARQCPEAC